MSLFVSAFAKKGPKNKLNILFIAVDDLRPELGCYGNRVIKSPNIDRLAKEGVLFSRAYCQQAICNPSRASLMTGLRPDSCKVIENKTYFRDTVPNVITLPEYFRRYGYTTISIGKVYHPGKEDPEKSWSRKPIHPVQSYKLGERQRQVTVYDDVPDTAYRDGQSAEGAIKILRELKENSRPFFLGVGFHKPHLPFHAPQKYWD
ncbi:MAG: iduronate-2-sulfatase, partial [Candidatus Thorarchaeota archaeon]